MMDNLPQLPIYAFQPNFGGLLSLMLTLVLPLAVAVIVTRVTSPRAKGILLLVIVAIKTLVEALVANNNSYIDFAWVPFLMNLIINFALAVIMHFGLWSPTKLSLFVQDNIGFTAPRRIHG